MQLSMGEIGNYLDASRAYLENIKIRLAQMGYCCPYSIIGDLTDEQDELDRIYYQELQRSGIGFPLLVWAAAAAGSIAASIGAYVYSHYTQVKIQSDRLDCLAKYQVIFENDGLSRADAASKAAAICEGTVGESTKNEVINTIKLAIYGGVAIFGLYILSKFIVKKN